ncbi:MAG: hypothetical protein KUG57_11105 [Ilumatobacteraceae bacterium]|nr:hypothetical protein [Ilumatobacteraceae bacterium]
MSSDRASIKKALEAAGDVPVEPVEPRLAALEDRLMAGIAVDTDESKPVVVPFQSKRRMAAARRVALGAVAACLLAAVVLAAGWLTTDNESYVIAAADDVTVTLPDGSTEAAEAGSKLPIGAEIEVRGSMVVSGITYGPGSYTVTDKGVAEAELDENTPTTTGEGAPVEQVTDVAPAPPATPRPRSSVPVASSTTIRPRDRLDELERVPTSVSNPRLPADPIDGDRDPSDRIIEDGVAPTTTTLRDRAPTASPVPPPRPPQPTTSTTAPHERQRDGT